jgi:phage repressor protein C with HTH and peptisase S24 domain
MKKPRRLGDLPRGATDGELVVIPRVDIVASAGNGSPVTTEDEIGGLSFSRLWLSRRGMNPAQCRVIDIGGSSMEPKLFDGHKALVHMGETTPRSGRAYVLRQDDELLVKYLQLLPGGILRVSSENSAFPTYDIDLSKTDRVSILGRVRASSHEW